MSGSYVVAIKASARRRNPAAAEHVAREGSTRAFDSKAAAREWAADVSADSPVRVQDAAPNDPAAVDGYLVADPARHGRGSRSAASGTLDSF